MKIVGEQTDVCAPSVAEEGLEATPFVGAMPGSIPGPSAPDELDA